jgi:hypothetical protein
MLTIMLYPFLPYGKKPLIEWLLPSAGASRDGFSGPQQYAEDSEESVLVDSRRPTFSTSTCTTAVGQVQCPPVTIIYGSPMHDWMEAE